MNARSTQQGATAVELALVLGLFTLLALAVVDLARWTLTAASLQEAARHGARVAAVCDPNDPQAISDAQARIVGLRSLAVAPTVRVQALPTGCSRASCTQVQADLRGAVLQTVSPLWPAGLPLPAATLELPRESLSSALDGRTNPLCN